MNMEMFGFSFQQRTS